MKLNLRLYKWLTQHCTGRKWQNKNLSWTLIPEAFFCPSVSLGSPDTSLKAHFVWIGQRCPCSRHVAANCQKIIFFFFQKIILIIIKINVIKGIVVGGSPDMGGQEPLLPSALSEGLIASSFSFPVRFHLPTWARHVLLQGRAGGALRQLLFRLSETVESFQHSR